MISRQMKSWVGAFDRTGPSSGGGAVGGPRPYGSGVLRRYRPAALGDLHLISAAQLWFGFEHPNPG